MNPNLHEDALHIVTSAIDAVKPDAAVRRALQGVTFPRRVFLVAVGKAGWQISNGVIEFLPETQRDAPHECEVSLCAFMAV